LTRFSVLSCARKPLQQPEFNEVRNCVSDFSRELAAPLSKLVLFFMPPFAAATNR
jgi:hypothetical protein